MRNLYAAMTFLVTLGACAADESRAEYAPVPGEFPLTRWAKDVAPQFLPVFSLNGVRLGFYHLKPCSQERRKP